MTDRTARRFMTVAREYGDRPEVVAGLNGRALHALAAPELSVEVREEIERRRRKAVIETTSRELDDVSQFEF